MSAAQRTTAEIIEQMVADYQRAKFIFENSRLGAPRGDAAERKIERLVERAEKLGILDEFIRAI